MLFVPIFGSTVFNFCERITRRQNVGFPQQQHRRHFIATFEIEDVETGVENIISFAESTAGYRWGGKRASLSCFAKPRENI